MFSSLYRTLSDVLTDLLPVRTSHQDHQPLHVSGAHIKPPIHVTTQKEREMPNTEATVINADSPLFFPVALKPLGSILSGHANTNLQAVCRLASNDNERDEVIAVHKKNYKLVPNLEVYSAFERALAASGISMSNLLVEDRLAYQGGRALRTYRFPDHKYDIGANDPVMLQLRVSNSYDGTSRFSVLFGAFRVVCSNGMVIGESLVNTQQKHTASLDVGRIAAQLRTAVTVLERNTQQWRAWKEQPCPMSLAQAAVDKMNVTDAVKGSIMTHFAANQDSEGNSIWALFNAMTYWSSHTPVKVSSTENFSALMLEREQKVRAALNQPLFQMAA